MVNVTLLEATSDNFFADLEQLLSRDDQTVTDIEKTVADIIQSVRSGGDDASLLKHVQQLDHYSASSCRPTRN